jgi:hypothetical protein
MTKTKKTIIIFTLIISLILVLLFVFLGPKVNNSTAEAGKNIQNQTQNQTQTSGTSTSPTKEKSRFSPIIRAKVREEFISSCKNAYNGQYATKCECAADYLSSNYSEDQLAQMYKNYHTTKELPTELEKAIESCK